MHLKKHLTIITVYPVPYLPFLFLPICSLKHDVGEQHKSLWFIVFTEAIVGIQVCLFPIRCPIFSSQKVAQVLPVRWAAEPYGGISESFCISKQDLFSVGVQKAT